MASAPGLLKPMLLTSAWSLMARKRRGSGLPGCGCQVTPPSSLNPKPERRPDGNGLGELVHARRQADGVGKLRPKKVNGKFRRAIQGGGQAGAEAGGGRRRPERARVRSWIFSESWREKDRADEAAVEPTHGRNGRPGCGRGGGNGSGTANGLAAASDAGLG